ncbi:flagellar basal body-associated protein FliL [Lentibacillus sp. N15]|uniref:flagellar basal body-associated protein FliL n=1 Tax=Lentibacillus songyuanensis TaxID=3136161 RepID=UPI0031B9F9DA
MNKLVKTMLTTLAILIVGGAVAITVVWNVKDDKSSSAQSLDNMVEYSYQTDDITTDLEDGSFVRIQFQLVTDSKKAKAEVEKREFQIKNILIKELATMKEADFKSGLTDLEDTIKQKLNGVMAEGKVTDVYTISKILQ